MWYIYIVENYKAIKKLCFFANNAICSNKDGPRHDHTKRPKSDKDKSYCLYVESKMNLFTKQRETHRRRKQAYSPYGKGGRGRDKLGGWV